MPAKEEITGRMRKLAKPDAEEDDSGKIKEDDDPVSNRKRDSDCRENRRDICIGD